MIKIGNLNISSFKLGGADCSIYLGSVKLYPTEEPTPPAPMNVITYEASEKLAETTSYYSNGLHINVFKDTNGQQLTMTNHTFENGVGTIVFNGDIASIGGNAFYNCSGLTSIDIPSSVTSIGEAAFMGCSNLTSVNIPDGVTIISEGTFMGCSSLTSVTIPNSVTYIGRSVFDSCTSLTSIVIPSSVTSISDSSFYGCSGLTSVTVEPTTPPTLGSGAFGNTNNNLVIYVPSASVDAYKSATRWSIYASRIQAIP